MSRQRRGRRGWRQEGKGGGTKEEHCTGTRCPRSLGLNRETSLKRISLFWGTGLLLLLDRDDDPDPLIFGLLDPDPLLFSSDLDPTCNNRCILCVQEVVILFM